MFKRRKLEVKVVEDIPEAAVEREPRRDEFLWGANASVLVDNIVVGGALLIGAYFAADTIRACAIHTVVTRVTPAIVVEAAKK